MTAIASEVKTDMWLSGMDPTFRTCGFFAFQFIKRLERVLQAGVHTVFI
jgi:hypothetical protein